MTDEKVERENPEYVKEQQIAAMFSVEQQLRRQRFHDIFCAVVSKGCDFATIEQYASDLLRREDAALKELEK